MKINPLKGKIILLVNTGGQKKRFILKRLKQLELYVVVLNQEKIRAQSYVDEWIIADTSNHNESIQAVEKFIKTHPQIKFDGILTFWEDDVLLTSKLVDKYNMIGIPYLISSHVRNKFLFRDFCRENNMPFPKFKSINNRNDLEKISSEFRFPIVLKPVFGTSSAYVIKAKTKEELYKSYDYIYNNISTKTESALTDGLDLFVEEYIDGDELDIDILLQNGKTKFVSISDNFDKSWGSFFYDSGQAMPSSLPTEDQEETIEMVELVLEKLGIFNGCIHFEAKYTKNGPVPIEVNLRMGGDYVYSYNKTTWGIDLIECAVKIATGEYFKVEQKDAPKKYTIGWDIHPEESGIVTELDIDESLFKEKYFEDIFLSKELGDPLLVPPEGYDSIGWITVSGDNPLDVRDNLRYALEKINYKVVPYDEESFLGKTLRKDRFSMATLNKELLLKSAKVEKIKQVRKEDLKKLKIGIVGNGNNVMDPVDTQLYCSATDVNKILTDHGYNTQLFIINELSSLVNQVKAADVDIIINLAKKVDNFNYNEIRITNFLENSNIPFTGSDTFPLTISNDKITFKKLLTYHDIPTPNWDYAYSLDSEIDDELEYPLIVKPAYRNDSIGITNSSVVTNEKDLHKQIQKVLTTYKSPALIEEYIEGDEYSVVILGNDDHDYRILPLSRTIYDKLGKDFWHILSYDAKWTDNIEYKKIVFENPPKKISKKLEQLITEISLDTYSIVRCRDYGQVEIKVDKNDNPYIIELNTNPVLNTNSIMTRSASVLKLKHLDLIEEIILSAIRRYKNQ